MAILSAIDDGRETGTLAMAAACSFAARRSAFHGKSPVAIHMAESY
jgi:hypothetical protein